MSRHQTALPVADPQPAVGDQTVSARNTVVKENYPHSFATPLCAPSEVDLQRFWMLERPLNLCNAFDRDRLHLWIQESIERSCDWIDVRKSCQEREPLDAAVHQALLAEAYALLAYKRACLALLAKLEEPVAPKPTAKAIKPQSLMRERYVAAWALKQSLR